MRQPVRGDNRMCWADVVVAYHRAIRSFDVTIQPVLDANGLGRLGITNVLFLLSLGKSPQRFADLVREEHYAGSNASYALNNLSQAGLVIRDPDPEDRRLRLVRVTPRGARLIDEICAVSSGDERTVMSALRAAGQMERIRPPRSRPERHVAVVDHPPVEPGVEEIALAAAIAGARHATDAIAEAAIVD